MIAVSDINKMYKLKQNGIGRLVKFMNLGENSTLTLNVTIL